jgi:hypothetical protein
VTHGDYSSCQAETRPRSYRIGWTIRAYAGVGAATYPHLGALGARTSLAPASGCERRHRSLEGDDTRHLWPRSAPQTRRGAAGYSLDHLAWRIAIAVVRSVRTAGVSTRRRGLFWPQKTRRPEEPSGAQVFQSPSLTRERCPLRPISTRGVPKLFGRGNTPATVDKTAPPRTASGESMSQK